MLSEVHATTYAMAPVLSGVAGVTALRSDTLRRAYAYTSLGLVSFPTDPFPGGGTIIPLSNPGATVFRLISN
jgi:hypothetical protein